MDKDGEVTIVALVVRYLNADAEGKYRKGPNGEIPPIVVGASVHVRLGQFNMKQIKKLAPEDSDIFGIDIVMSIAEGTCIRLRLHRPNGGLARWKKNPEFIEEIKQAVQSLRRWQDTDSEARQETHRDGMESPAFRQQYRCRGNKARKYGRAINLNCNFEAPVRGGFCFAHLFGKTSINA
jgi:hypothetical protein